MEEIPLVGIFTVRALLCGKERQRRKRGHREKNGKAGQTTKIVTHHSSHHPHNQLHNFVLRALFSYDSNRIPYQGAGTKSKDDVMGKISW